MVPQLLFLVLAFSAFVSSKIGKDREFECQQNDSKTAIKCEPGQNLCVRRKQCNESKDDQFFSNCVWNENHAIYSCAKNDCKDCEICEINKKCRAVKSMKNTLGYIRWKQLKALPSSSEFSSTISSSMAPPSSAISVFSNGSKWESFIPVAILTTSTLLLTAAIF